MRRNTCVSIRLMCRVHLSRFACAIEALNVAFAISTFSLTLGRHKTPATCHLSGIVLSAGRAPELRQAETPPSFRGAETGQFLGSLCARDCVIRREPA